jgi:hypothetical protein
MSVPTLAQILPGTPVPRGISTQILLSRYQRTQHAIAVRAALAIIHLWDRVVNPDKFMDSWERLSPVVQGIVATHYQMSAANAAEFYGHDRVMAGLPAFAVPGTSLDTGQLSTVVNSMGAGQFFHYAKDEDADTASTMARDGLRGAGTRLVLLGGRDTIVKAAGADPKAIGWERIIESRACGFCSMLAGRGGVYSEKSVNFRAHDHCECVGAPVFPGQTPVNQGLSEQWGSVTKGKRGAAARAAWDTHWSNHVESIHGPASETPAVGAGHGAIGHESER